MIEQIRLDSEKYADVRLASDIYKQLEDFKGKKNKTYTLVVAVSPDIYWGPNKNNDGFTEYWLKKKHSTFCTHDKDNLSRVGIKHYT